jgi:hypothetical protein
MLLAAKSLSGGLRRTTSRRCGGFAKEVARNIEKGEAPTFSGCFRIRLDENLDDLVAGVDLDTDSRVAKVHLVASPVLSSNDGVGHVVSFPGSVVSAASAYYRDARNPAVGVLNERETQSAVR